MIKYVVSPATTFGIHSALFASKIIVIVFQNNKKKEEKELKTKKNYHNTISSFSLSLIEISRKHTAACWAFQVTWISLIQLIYAWISTGNSTNRKNRLRVRISHLFQCRKKEKDYFIILLLCIWLIWMIHQRHIMYAACIHYYKRIKNTSDLTSVLLTFPQIAENRVISDRFRLSWKFFFSTFWFKIDRPQIF